MIGRLPSPSRRTQACVRRRAWPGWALLPVLLGATLVPDKAAAQAPPCNLGTIAGRPEVQALQCGDELTIIAETAADVRVSTSAAGQWTATVNSGAAEFQFRASARQPGFQILTPHAVAAVRGTTWAVDVGAANTALFVEEGAVAVDDFRGFGPVLVKRGQGVVAGNEAPGATRSLGRGPGVAQGGEPLVPTRWAPTRVKALMARLGR